MCLERIKSPFGVISPEFSLSNEGEVGPGRWIGGHVCAWYIWHPASMIGAIQGMWKKKKKKETLSPKSCDISANNENLGNISNHSTENKSVRLSNKVAILL